MAYVVRVAWSSAKGSVSTPVHYLVHREERNGGAARKIHGHGPRYEPLAQDEPEFVRQIQEDGAGLHAGRLYKIKLTVDDEAARRLARLRLRERDRALRRATVATLRDVLPLAAGLYVLHSHGGQGRPWGHPHIHVILSPRLESGRQTRLSATDLQRLRESWEREVGRALERAPRRPTISDRTAPHPATETRRRQPAPARDNLRVALCRAGALGGLLIRSLPSPDDDEGPRKTRA